MDLVDIIEEKRFLGQEFLTWLWFKSEERGGNVLLPGAGDIIVVFEKHMLLEYGEGEANEKLICRGLHTELKEARTGLAMGKKLEQARIRLAKGDYEWELTLTATLFEFRSVKVPKSMGESEEDKGPEAAEARMLDRIGMIEDLSQTINALFRVFLKLRVGQDWEEELTKVQSWVRRAAARG